MRDLLTVAGKEWRELLGGPGFRGKSGIALTIAVFGIVLPLQTGRAWIESPLALASWIWVPMFLVASVITEAFAGERERHTLETLAATRLSNEAILYGKMTAAVVYAIAVSAISLLLGLVAVNLQAKGDGLIMFSPVVLGVVALVGILGAILVAAAGTMISLHSPTVRQAVQLLGGVIMVVFLAPILIAKEFGQPLLALVGAMDPITLVALFFAAATILDVAVVALAHRRFNRSKITAV
jgi:ABC-2 type transport system permease protein